ncbi:MAG TPA: DUF6629 family protein [Gemmatimonadaceae bacterium]|nr:DUF6629 family protein [Gemmatimonadaceae bacterium]
MCFSATASFTASGVLTALGAASVARGARGRYWLFAATPLLFAAQQAAEGIIWLTVDDPAPIALTRAATDAFLAIALVIWPIWLPLSLRTGEARPQRRRVLSAMMILGVLVSVAAVVLLSRWQPLAVVVHQRIRYDRAGSLSTVADVLVLLAYFSVTVAPLFISTIRLGRVLGVALIASLVAAALIERDSITSVWCFFAALLSGIMIMSVRDMPSPQAA